MPRYVIEMSEPKTCNDCPLIYLDRVEGLEPAECQLANGKWVPNFYGDCKPPEWCPLKPLD